MKKVLLFLICIFLLVGCDFKNLTYSDYTYLTYSELETKLDNKDTFVLVIGSDTCSACAVYEDTMKKVIKENNIEIFFLNLNKLTDEERDKAHSKYVYKYTPTTVFIKSGEEIGTYTRIVGAAEYDDVVAKLKQLEYIGE